MKLDYVTDWLRAKVYNVIEMIKVPWWNNNSICDQFRENYVFPWFQTTSSLFRQQSWKQVTPASCLSDCCPLKLSLGTMMAWDHGSVWQQGWEQQRYLQPAVWKQSSTWWSGVVYPNHEDQRAGLSGNHRLCTGHRGPLGEQWLVDPASGWHVWTARCIWTLLMITGFWLWNIHL